MESVIAAIEEVQKTVSFKEKDLNRLRSDER